MRGESSPSRTSRPLICAGLPGRMVPRSVARARRRLRWASAPAGPTSRSVGTVAFTVPAAPGGARVRLELRLRAADGRELSRNHHEMYFFPRRSSTSAPHSRAQSPRLRRRLGDLGYEMTDEPSQPTWSWSRR